MADKRLYIKMDVGYLSNPKIARLTRPAAVLLHMASIAYARQHLTNGRVPVDLLVRTTLGAKPDDAQALFRLGLWDDVGDGEAEVHDYLKHQQSAEDIAAASKKGRSAAHARWNASGNASGMQDGLHQNARSAASDADVDGREGRRYQNVTASGKSRNQAGFGVAAGQSVNPNASGMQDALHTAMPEERRGEEKEHSSPEATATELDLDFERWWSEYPRKVGKGQARKAYRAARRKVDPQVLMDTLRRQRADWRDPKFTPHPATWLNGERWDDEPPRRASGQDYDPTNVATWGPPGGMP